MQIKFLTTALQKPYTLAGFEHGIFCSGDGRDNHYAKPPGQLVTFFSIGKLLFSH
jgi:hypothetical protein